jgi:hypothetical protein
MVGRRYLNEDPTGPTATLSMIKHPIIRAPRHCDAEPVVLSAHELVEELGGLGGKYKSP